MKWVGVRVFYVGEEGWVEGIEVGEEGCFEGGCCWRVGLGVEFRWDSGDVFGE